MIWFGWVLVHMNHCRLSNAKSSLYIYFKYIYCHVMAHGDEEVGMILPSRIAISAF